MRYRFASGIEKAGQVASGKSPAKEKKLARSGFAIRPTLRDCGERYYNEQVCKNWKDPSDVRRYLDNEIFPTQLAEALV
jgi:hypothetical protein